MEQQILKAINHIKYVSKKGVTISGIQRFLKKKSTTTFDETSLGEIICEMQQNGKIDVKFKIMNPIYDDKNFAEIVLAFENDRKLEKTIRQWWKSRRNLHGPFKSFWHDQSQFALVKTKSVWFF